MIHHTKLYEITESLGKYTWLITVSSSDYTELTDRMTNE
jgi:hypothetical protein